MCLYSNNIHHCSLATCKHINVHDEEQVCEITGICYPLDFIIPTQYECAKRSAPKQSQNAVIKPAKRARLGGEFGVSEKHQAEAYDVIKDILSKVKLSGETSSLIGLVDIKQLVDISQSLWRECIQTREYNLKPFRYRHRYHVIVVLYAGISGLKTPDGDKVLVPQNDVLKQWLPMRKTLPSLTRNKLQTGMITKTNKLFLAFMRELYPNLL